VTLVHLISIPTKLAFYSPTALHVPVVYKISARLLGVGWHRCGFWGGSGRSGLSGWEANIPRSKAQVNYTRAHRWREHIARGLPCSSCNSNIYLFKWNVFCVPQSPSGCSEPRLYTWEMHEQYYWYCQWASGSITPNNFRVKAAAKRHHQLAVALTKLIPWNDQSLTRKLPAVLHGKSGFSPAVSLRISSYPFLLLPLTTSIYHIYLKS
jgi:hypothetical protein